MDFPKQTKELADRVAHEIRQQRGSDQLELAKGVYGFLHKKFGYGFLEGMSQGYFIRYPHEIKEQWECIESAVYVYALAEALRLEPKMRRVTRWMGANAGHETVDVKVNGNRVLIDPLNSMFGSVSYTNKGIEVEDNQLTERCIIPCSTIEEIPKSLILARMEYYRSDDGVVNLLRTGQSYRKPPITTIFIFYDPKTRVLELQLRQQAAFLEPWYFAQRYQIGKSESSIVTLEHGVYKGQNWSELIGKEPFWKRTTKENQATKIEWYQLKNFGLTRLLRDLLYEIFFDNGFQVSNEGYGYLFNNREKPLERLVLQIDQLKSEGINPKNKGEYHALRHAYFDFIALDHVMPFVTQTWLDRATLDAYVRISAKEHGVNSISEYKRILKDLGINPKQYTAEFFVDQKVLIGPSIEVSELDSTYQLLKPFFERLARKGLI